MKLKNIFWAIILVGIIGCTEQWEEHYDVYPDTVNENVWDAVQSENDVSEFVQLIKEFQLDTLFQTNDPYTLFIPTNSALSAYRNGNTVNEMLLNYLITPHFVQSRDIIGKRKVQTLGKKFILIESNGNAIKVDGVPILKESPLYKNGKFFILDEVVETKPSIYEFFAKENPVLKHYIDEQDSIIIDKEKSKPLGFDENGNTIYDTVSIIFNMFEAEYFPVKQEFRHQTATVVFPRSADYNDALTEMAQKMNSSKFNDYNDIPLEWQNEVLIPHILEQGVFENMIEPEEFTWKTPADTAKLKNIKGDSVAIFYTPTEKVICSNGYVYNYESFVIPDSLFLAPDIFEAEWLLKETGANKFSWREWVNVESDIPFAPGRLQNQYASNDSLVSVIFPYNYKGKFSVEFNTRPLFPRKYLMVVNTHMNYGGVYDIYVNDKFIRTFDYYDFIRYRQYNYSVTGARYAPTGSLNRFDMWIDDVKEYGRLKIRFEYKGPGYLMDNGFIIDYISFIPYEE